MARKSRSKAPARRRTKRKPSLFAFLRLPEYRFYKRRHVLKFSSIGVFVTVLVAFCYSPYPYQMWEKSTQAAIRLSQRAGFTVNEILVVGRRSADPQMIMQAVQVKSGDPIFSISPQDVRKRLEENPWIRNAIVQRKLPGTCVIQVVERQPAAVWQHQEKFYLVDDQGIILMPVANSAQAPFPLIIGKDAPLYAPQLLKIIESFPQVKQRVYSLMYVSNRRWNLFLDRSLEVRLPEQGVEKALARLAVLIDQKKLDPQEIYMVDLRIPDRTIIRLSSSGSTRLKVKGRET